MSMDLKENSIKFIKGDGNYSHITRVNGSVECVSKTLKVLTTMISDKFIRVHKSYLVNKDFLRAIDEVNESVILKCQTLIPTSRRQWPVVKDHLLHSDHPVHFDHLKHVMHYFGYDFHSITGGVWMFNHKKLSGNFCCIKPFSVYMQIDTDKPIIASIEFRSGESLLNSRRVSFTKVKTWVGLFNAVRTHTRSLLHKRDVYKYKHGVL